MSLFYLELEKISLRPGYNLVLPKKIFIGISPSPRTHQARTIWNRITCWRSGDYALSVRLRCSLSWHWMWLWNLKWDFSLLPPSVKVNMGSFSAVSFLPLTFYWCHSPLESWVCVGSPLDYVMWADLMSSVLCAPDKLSELKFKAPTFCSHCLWCSLTLRVPAFTSFLSSALPFLPLWYILKIWPFFHPVLSGFPLLPYIIPSAVLIEKENSFVNIVLSSICKLRLSGASSYRNT